MPTAGSPYVHGTREALLSLNNMSAMRQQYIFDQWWGQVVMHDA